MSILNSISENVVHFVGCLIFSVSGCYGFILLLVSLLSSSLLHLLHFLLHLLLLSSAFSLLCSFGLSSDVFRGLPFLFFLLAFEARCGLVLPDTKVVLHRDSLLVSNEAQKATHNNEDDQLTHASASFVDVGGILFQLFCLDGVLPEANVSSVPYLDRVFVTIH